MDKLNCFSIYCLLYNALLTIAFAQYQGSEKATDPHEPWYAAKGAHEGKKAAASGPHIGGQQPGTGTGTWPQFPARGKPPPRPPVPGGARKPVVRPDPPAAPVTRPPVSGSGGARKPAHPNPPSAPVTQPPVSGGGGARNPARPNSPSAPVTQPPVSGGGGARRPARPNSPSAPFTRPPVSGGGGARRPARPNSPSGPFTRPPVSGGGGARRPIAPVGTIRPQQPSNPVNPGWPQQPSNPVNPGGGSFKPPIPTIGVVIPIGPASPTDVTFRPRPRYNPPVVTQPPKPCSIRQRNPCSNRGYCYIDTLGFPKCKCRVQYAGEQCQMLLKSPKNITMVDVSSSYVSISWESPPVDLKKITGFVVQYNKFGDAQTRFSPHIHPGVTDYTLRELEAESQYTICINIIFKNVTARSAILRDQCLEIRTQPSEYNSDGFSMTFMALVIGAVVLVLLIVMVLALMIQRRCLKPMRAPMRQIQRALTRRSMAIVHQRHKHNANHHNHINYQAPVASARISSRGRGRPPSNEDEASCVKVHRMPPEDPRNPFISQLHTNNGNNSDFKDWALPVSVNYSRFRVPPDVQPPKYSRSSSCSKANFDLIDMRSQSPSSRTRTELSTFGNQRTNLRSSRSVPGHAGHAVRALPPTVSKQVMRSKNAREKDASNEFDMKGSYMYFAPSGQNLRY